MTTRLHCFLLNFYFADNSACCSNIKKYTIEHCLQIFSRMWYMLTERVYKHADTPLMLVLIHN
jgi:hypothetical protein